MHSTYVHCLLMGALVSASACTEPDPTASPNPSLGVARFTITENVHTSTVVGLDEAGHEVARLELVHGPFAVTGTFQDDYPGRAQIDGRKLDVSIDGTKHLIYETEGFEPVLHLPAHPPGEIKLAAFLDDPHVKPLLERWQLGWEVTTDSNKEVSYLSGSVSGSSPFDCSTPATTCGTAAGGTINTCGGGTPANVAKRVTLSSPYSEYEVTQCCPGGSGGQIGDWFAIKSCPLSGTASTCGTATGACKACPTYPVVADGYCNIETNIAGAYYCYDTRADADPTLTVVIAGDGYGSVSGGPGLRPQARWGITCDNFGGGGTDCSEQHSCDGVAVTLNATPMNSTYYYFAGWSGGGCGTDPTCETALWGNTTIYATFACYGGTCP